MALSRQEIYFNYQECLSTVTNLLKSHYSWKNHYEPSLDDFAQTVVGDAQIVLMLQTVPFDPAEMTNIIKDRIEKTRKEFIPDLRKKQFSPIFDSTHQLIDDYEGDINEVHIEHAMGLLRDALPKIKYDLLMKIMDQNKREIPLWITQLDSVPEIKKKLDIFNTFFPDGRISDTQCLIASEHQSREQVENCYKCVYLGIEDQFPENFLKYDGLVRAGVLVRFLTEGIFKTNPQTILENENINFLTENKLQNVARLFNYSLNRALRNAYPDLILPWVNSRIPNKYWEEAQNRVEAVRWLVEQHLGMEIENLKASKIKRSVFSRNGLSFLYNTYYNSISKALGEAYPFLNRWELGSVPYDFWTDDTAAKAIRWMIRKKEWKNSEIPFLVKLKKFNKKTFTEYGLATLFDKKFNKNMFQAVNCAFPGQFKPWELGKVSSSYWKKPEHLFQAAEWIANQEGIEADKIIRAIGQQKITLATIKKYSIGSALKNQSQGYLSNLFWPYLTKERQQYNDEIKLIRKLNNLINEQQKSRTILQLLQHGFYFGLHRHLIRSQMQNLERMRYRILKRQKIPSS